MMALGSIELTEVSVQQAETMPGMAHFAGTGPAGKTCGDCAHKGYHRKRSPQFDPATNDWKEKTYKTQGCAKFCQLTNNHGPSIDSKLRACKYFEQKLK